MRRKTVVRVASIILSAGMLLQPMSAMAEGNVKAPISTEVAQGDTYGAADKLEYSSDELKDAVDAAEKADKAAYDAQQKADKAQSAAESALKAAEKLYERVDRVADIVDEKDESMKKEVKEELKKEVKKEELAIADGIWAAPGVEVHSSTTSTTTTTNTTTRPVAEPEPDEEDDELNVHIKGQNRTDFAVKMNEKAVEAKDDFNELKGSTTSAFEENAGKILGDAKEVVDGKMNDLAEAVDAADKAEDNAQLALEAVKKAEA